HLRTQLFDQFPYTRANPLLPGILDTTAKYPYAVKPSPVALRMPTQVILGSMPCQIARRFQCFSKTALQLVPEPFHSPGFDDVLQPAEAAVLAVAEISMNRNHGLRGRQQSVRTHESDRVGEARVGRTHAVGLPEAAASQHCESGEHAAVEVSDEAQVVAVN